MGRPPSNGGPSFRFNSVEVAEMDTILQAHDCAMPSREVLEALAEKFNLSAERSGKIVVQMKQVWHWFQNRRYALRAKAARAPGTVYVPPPTQDDSSIVKNVPHSPQSKPTPQETVINVPQALQCVPAPASEFESSYVGTKGAANNLMDFEAKSARDGAWYDVAMFLSHRNVEAMDPEVLVRFSGFGSEEDEWVNISRLVRKRSLPCESSECVAVLQGDLILCFQEGKEQALYFDAHVLDAQRRRHDVRGCRCRFLVRYDHDQSEEIVPLRKVCRRPETDYRLQQLHALKESTTTNQPKAGALPHTDNNSRAYPPAEPTQKQHKIEDLSDDVFVLPAAPQSILPAVNENEVQQPKDPDIVFAGTPENLSAAQPQVAEIISPDSLGISDVANVIKQPEVTVIIDGANPENINAPAGIIIQQEVAESVNLERSDAPPGIVTEQAKITESVNTDNTETSYVPALNVLPQTKGESSDSLESTLVPPGNAV